MIRPRFFGPEPGYVSTRAGGKEFQNMSPSNNTYDLQSSRMTNTFETTTKRFDYRSFKLVV